MNNNIVNIEDKIVESKRFNMLKLLRDGKDDEGIKIGLELIKDIKKSNNLYFYKKHKGLICDVYYDIARVYKKENSIKMAILYSKKAIKYIKYDYQDNCINWLLARFEQQMNLNEKALKRYLKCKKFYSTDKRYEGLLEICVDINIEYINENVENLESILKNFQNISDESFINAYGKNGRTLLEDEISESICRICINKKYDDKFYESLHNIIDENIKNNLLNLRNQQQLHIAM